MQCRYTMTSITSTHLLLCCLRPPLPHELRFRQITNNKKNAQSNHSKIISGMREVERRARTAGGRVWALIRGRSRQRDSTDGDQAESNDSEGTASDEGVSTRDFGVDGALSGDGNVGGGDANNAPEWMVSRLDLMRRRGSFLDGDELGPVRTAVAQTAASGFDAVAGGEHATTTATGNDGANSSESMAESFGGLARLVLDEGGGDRDDTDEALAALRESMGQHSAALAQLVEWMAQVATPPGGAGGSGETALAAPAQCHPAVARAVAGPLAAPASPAPWPQLVGGASNFSVSNGALPALDAAATMPARTTTTAGFPPEGPGGLSPLLGGGAGGHALGEDDGVLAALQLSGELDVLEGRVRRERFRAHRAADEEIHRTPGLYREACAAGNALILRGHDYLSQVRACRPRGEERRRRVVLV